MSRHTAQVVWERGAAAFVDGHYSRRHLLRFDGGLEVPGSASPAVVPAPLSDAAALDPEEAFVASLSSCHMLWFLDLALRAGWCVQRYADVAEGQLARNAAGKLAMTRVTLRPQVEFAGERRPTVDEIAVLHEQAHAACFIANSVRSDVRVEPR